MELASDLAAALRRFLPALVVAAFALGLLLAGRWWLGRRKGLEQRFAFQLWMLVLTAVGTVAVILVLPINDTTRGQLLSLLGLVLTAMIALSSTTFVANAMAGLMLRAVRNFRPGDFLRVGDQFGRVTERGLFHTEIQTEDRDLTTLPNLYVVTNPVTVVRSSGTIVSAELSLGYDVAHQTVEPLMLQAAQDAGLEEPFVHVMELGDFSVTYRVAGFLAEVKQLLSTRSRLRTCVMDTLHGAGVEIVSPTFMNQRRLADDAHVLPAPASPSHPIAESAPAEALVFDKAEEAEKQAEAEEAAAAEAAGEAPAGEADRAKGQAGGG